MACIPSNPRRVGYIVSIYGPLHICVGKAWVLKTTLPQTPHSAGSLRHWVRTFIYGPLDGPLYMSSIYTNTNCCDASTAKSCMIGRWRIAYVHSQCKIVKIT